MSGHVYLAGPITGQSYEGATDWRNELEDRFAEVGLEARSPMRGKHFLQGLAELGGSSREAYCKNVLASAPGVVTRDRNDVKTAALLVVNLLGASRISIGTMVELGWADAYRVPIIVIMEPGNLHDHMFVTQLAGFVVPDFEEAFTIACTVLNVQRGI